MLKMTRAMNFFKQLATGLTMAALLIALVPMEAFAASTGIALTPSSATTPVDVQVNFKATVEKSGASTHAYLTVTDSASGGSFYDSNGNCSNVTPDADNQFAIESNKNICYSNSAPGVYNITVQLFDSLGAPIGSSKNLSITVVAEAPNPNIEIPICHASNSHTNPYQTQTPADASQIVSGHDDHNGPVWFEGITEAWGDIIPPFTWYEKVGTGQDAVWVPKEYLGKNWTVEGQAVYNNKCTFPPKKADLAITKAANNATPFEGNDVTYTIMVSNAGPMTATNVSVVDPLAIGLTYKSASVAPSATAPLTWNIPTLPSGASWSVDVVVAVGADQGGLSITNTATVSGAPADPDSTNNSGSATIRPIDVTVPVPGCTDVDAKNYSSQATVDNGSCLFELMVNKVIVGKTSVELDQFAFTVNGAVATSFDENGNATVLVPNGEYNIVEVLAPGFTVGYNNCAPAVIQGAPATCTITNTVVVVKPPICTVGENLLQNGSFETPVVTGDWGIFNSVANWTIALSDGLELWRNFMGGASDGVQNAELDGNAPTKISQAVTTVPGATYSLRFDFSPRPGTSLADNAVEAAVDGITLMAVAGDGSALSANQWTASPATTFVASTTSTVISFEDKGTDVVSYGSLIDNAVLCFVSAPAPKTCSIVSDTTTLVGGVPSTLTWVHPAWTTELTSGEWIWDATVEATNGETATFTKTFMVDNAATGATLKVAADNRYTATLNGNPLTCDGTPADNFSAADSCAAPVVVGLNTLTFVVTNDPYATVDVQTNPSGLIFELTIDGATCSPVIPPTPTGDTYKIQGYVWHDDNQNTNWDGMEESLIEVPAESPLAGWEVRITSGTTTYATTTDADGYYYFEVPAGTWVITEVVQSGWLRTTVESHTVTVPAEMAEARSAFMEWLIPTAQAAVIGLPYGDYNFGNDTETVITTTPDSSSRSSGGSSSSRPRGRVAGLSDSTPMPMVLGEQVSAVPTGAPSTGRGGAAPTTAVDSLLQLIGTSRRLQVLK